MPRYRRRRWKNFGGLAKANKKALVKTASEKPTAGWWITISSTGNKCEDCAEGIGRGTEFAFHYDPLGVLCVICADKRGLAPKLSKRAVKHRSQQQLAI